MRKKIPSTELKNLIVFLEKTSKKSKSRFWRDVAERLSTSRRRMAEVNIGKIDKNTKEGTTVVVPGKVLASGSLTHTVDVAALRFSLDAERKISSQGSCMDIKALAEKNPKGTDIIIME